MLKLVLSERVRRLTAGQAAAEGDKNRWSSQRRLRTKNEKPLVKSKRRLRKKGPNKNRKMCYAATGREAEPTDKPPAP